MSDINPLSHFLFLFLFLLFSIVGRSQPEFPPPGEVFVDTSVPRVDIYIDPDTLIWLYENVESYQEFHATFKFDNGNVSETVENVGFRLRGNTSRYSAKKSFKVSFNTFDPGRQWYGLEKLNLNGEHNDPSVVRSKLCWDLLNDFEIPGARSNHVALYINNNYHGLYIHVEHIDEEFVLSRFGNNDGNLYKCLYPADLAYLGSNPGNYKLVQNDRRVYELKTNTVADDYSDLAHFIDVLNNTPDEDFLCAIEKVFNVYAYLKIIAFDVVTANWDGYIFNQNNFYLYFNTGTGKFEYINYDVDNTFGIDWFNIDWGTRDPYDWHTGFRPLYTRIMETPEFRDIYTYYLNYIATHLLDEEPYTNYTNNFKWQNSPYIQTDPFYPMDYGFTHNDYLNSFDEALGMHVKYGLFPFLESRKSSLAIQLENSTPGPVINYIRNNHPQEGENFRVRAFVESPDGGVSVKLSYSINNGQLQETEMFDDGEHGDKEAGDRVFGCLLQEMQMNTTISYQVTATNDAGLISAMPCEPITYELVPSANPALFINEFMASNVTTIADEFGEFDDWIELYNGGDEAVWLGDKYLSDNLSVEDKWLMPDFTLQPGDFVLFWADDDPGQGEFHINFKLDKEGEEIGIFDASNTGFVLLDSVSYGPQDDDASLGRKPDGAITWVPFTNTTPGFSNLLGNVDDLAAGYPLLKIYPNPIFNGQVQFDREVSFILYSLQGLPLFEAKEVKQVNLGMLRAGLYLIATSDGRTAKIIIH